MSKITKTLFGGADQKSSSGSTFDVKRTPHSNLSGGTLTIDPSVRALQEQGLAGIQGLIPGYQQGTAGVLGNLASTRQGLEGNQGAFMQARLNPLQEQIASRQGELQRGLGLRGLGGSSFGQQSLTNFATDAGRALGDAGALATQESLGALTGVDSQTMNALNQQAQMMSQLYGIPIEVAKQRLEQELQSFGLGKGTQSESKADQRGGLFPSLVPKGA